MGVLDATATINKRMLSRADAQAREQSIRDEFKSTQTRIAACVQLHSAQVDSEFPVWVPDSDATDGQFTGCIPEGFSAGENFKVVCERNEERHEYLVRCPAGAKAGD